MTHDRDIERLLDAWFSDGPTQTPDRVIDAVADRIDRQRQRPAWRLHPWRDIHMNGNLRVGTAAAAVILVAVVGFTVMRPSSPGVGGGPSPTASPSPSPTASSTSSSASPPAYMWPTTLSAGTYTTPFIWDVPFAVTFTVPDGWQSRDVEVFRGPIAVSFDVVDNVYADPCARMLQNPPVGTSVDALAESLSTLPGLEATAPTAVTIAGRTGKYLEYTVRPDISCAPGEFYIYHLDESLVRRDRGPWGGPDLAAQDGRVLARVWILDLDGTRYVMMATSSAEASPADLSELQGVIDSIRIDRVRAPSTTTAPQPSLP